MDLWLIWWEVVSQLRPACSRYKSFLWLCVVLAGFCIRNDLAGITSIIRALGLKEKCYHNIRFLYHSSAIDLQKLINLWLAIVLKIFNPVTLNGRLVFLGDGLKIGKEGKKMPGVKKLHQSSDNNNKAEYIMGHSFQCLGLLVSCFSGGVACVPIASKIHEGLVFTNRDLRTLLDKMASMFLDLAKETQRSCLLIADAYYSSQKIILPLIKSGHHLISRLKSSAVAYYPVKNVKKAKRGRPKKYGKKIKLTKLFEQTEDFKSIDSPVYNEIGVTIEYMMVDLLWKPIGNLVRFVLVKHPVRGRIIIMSTDLTLDALDIILGYSYRFKIELTFKQSLHVVGSYTYHFWLKCMEPLRRNSGNQYLHKKSTEYRKSVKRKFNAYELYVMVGCIAQGLLQHLAINHSQTVWGAFRGWLRTMKKDLSPSELVTAEALKASFPEFLVSKGDTNEMAKFIIENIEPTRSPILLEAG